MGGGLRSGQRLGVASVRLFQLRLFPIQTLNRLARIGVQRLFAGLVMGQLLNPPGQRFDPLQRAGLFRLKRVAGHQNAL